MASVRKEAPYLPSNVEFVAKCNGLKNSAEVAEFVSTTHYMVLGLGGSYILPHSTSN